MPALRGYFLAHPQHEAGPACPGATGNTEKAK
jgi:hypothetical protein